MRLPNPSEEYTPRETGQVVSVHGTGHSERIISVLPNHYDARATFTT
jgi:hypothetical protein